MTRLGGTDGALTTATRDFSARMRQGSTTDVPQLLPRFPNAQVVRQGDLVGVWKLVSWQVIVDNEPPQDVFGLHPKGYLILTGEGRDLVLTTAESRKPGTADPERAALHRSRLAYTGKYRVEGEDFVTRVDASWNEEWNGTEQRRHSN